MQYGAWILTLKRIGYKSSMIRVWTVAFVRSFGYLFSLHLNLEEESRLQATTLTRRMSIPSEEQITDRTCSCSLKTIRGAT